MLRGDALAATGRAVEAEADLRAARAAVEERGGRALLWRLDARLGRLYWAQGRRTEAEQAFAAARATVDALAADLADPALRATFLAGTRSLLPAPRAPSPRRSP